MRARQVTRVAAAALVAGVAAAAAPAAHAGPLGWNDPITVATPVGAPPRLTATAVSPDGSSHVVWSDVAGRISAVRVTADGRPGRPQLIATGQGTDVRGLQVVATDRYDVVAVWASGTTLRYAAAHLRGAFHGSHVIARIGSYTSATPDVAALHGGTVAAIWRDYAYRGRDVLRYARRAPGRSFGTAHALRSGVYPQVEATPDGGAVVAFQVGPLSHRTTFVGRARRAAPVPSGFASVAGRVRFHRLASSRRVRGVELLWTTREHVSRVRAREVWPHVDAAHDVPGSPHPASYEAPQLAVGYSGEVVSAWPQYDDGYHDVVTRSPAGGSFSVPAPLETTTVGMTGVPQILFDPDGGSSILNARSRTQVGPPVYDIVVTDPGATAPAAAPALGPAASSSTAGLSGGYGGGAQVAAWPATNGVSVAFRRG